MKMVKKILFGLVAVAAVLSLASCGIKKDDPEGIIKGTAGNYSVNYKYENADTTATYRAYKPTGFKHAGALVKVTFNAADLANIGNSKFGLIFGLKETKNGDQKIRDFYIIGLGAEKHNEEYGKYYVSKYENVVDIQAENFGAPEDGGAAAAGKPQETVKVGITNCSLPKDGEGNVYAYIWYQANNTTGAYDWKILNMEDSAATEWQTKQDTDKRGNSPTGTPIAYGSITGAFEPCDANKEPQDYIAVYARVQGSKTLNGKVNFKGDFREAEDIEPID